MIRACCVAKTIQAWYHIMYIHLEVYYVSTATRVYTLERAAFGNMSPREISIFTKTFFGVTIQQQKNKIRGVKNETKIAHIQQATLCL